MLIIDLPEGEETHWPEETLISPSQLEADGNRVASNVTANDINREWGDIASMFGPERT